MKSDFGHEKLRAYAESIKFVAWTTELLGSVPKNLSAWDQLDRASSSIPLNIAQANGKATASDRCQSFDVARGSALECAACLDVLLVRAKINQTDCFSGKAVLKAVVSMLIGLIKSTSSQRIHEDAVEYRAEDPRLTTNPRWSPSQTFFDHEKLKAYQESIRFIGLVCGFLERLPQGLSLSGKLDRASTAIPLSIAEGNGRFTAADRCRFFDHARGSALECAACLDTLVAGKRLMYTEIESAKCALPDIVSMIVGLIRSNCPDRIPAKGFRYGRIGKEGDASRSHSSHS